jgi:cytidylate kinase
MELYRPITLCGLAGVGKSTAIKQLIAELGFTLHSSGDFVRKHAQEIYPDISKALALEQLEEDARRDPSIDHMIDGRTIDLAKSGKSRWILDSRLGWYFCPQSFKVIMTCDTVERIRRIAKRDNIEFSAAYYQTEHRESAIKDRYLKLYGITDFTSPHLFNHVANTTTARPEAVADRILIAYKEWHNNHSN